MHRLALLVALVALSAVAAPAAGAEYGYLSRPTDQLAVPGHLAGAELTPEGFVFTGSGEVVFGAGPRLAPLVAPTRTMAAGRLPVLRSAVRRGGVDYRLETFAAEVAGEPVVFLRAELRNPGRRPRTAGWSSAVRHGGGDFRFRRPEIAAFPGLYSQPGEAFAPGARYAFAADGAVMRDDRAVLLPPPAAAGARLTRRLRRGTGPATPATPFGLTAQRLRLAPGQAVRLDHRIPVEPRPAGDERLAATAAPPHDAARAATLARWRGALAGRMRLDLPERRVEEAFDASLVHLLEPRYRLPDGRWVQPVNKLQYHAFWLRDGAMITHALDLAGLHAPARENLGFFGAFQRPDGHFISRPGQLDGHGQALWAIGDHARRTGDRAFAREMLPRVQRGMDWLRAARAQDPLGLVPPSDPNDNELVAGHLAGDQFWAVAGVDSAVALAELLGEDALADRWRAELADLRATVDRRVRDAAARTGGAIPPALDAGGGKDWGNLWAAWPGRTLDPDDPLVGRTLSATRRSWREGIATYGRSLHGYLGFRVLQTELARGQQRRVVAGLYSALAHTTATHGGFEIGMRPFGSRLTTGNMAPHGWFAAELVALVRNMLVREEGDGLELLGALPPAWLRPGRPTVVRDASTPHGAVDVRLVPRRGGATLTWDAGVPAGTPLTWRVPDGVRAVRAPGLVPGARTLRLPGPSGTLRVSWRLERGAPSFARTVARLRAAYRRRGATPPG